MISRNLIGIKRGSPAPPVSNTDMAIFMSGLYGTASATSTDKYTLSTSTSASSSSLSASKCTGASLSSLDNGIIIGGYVAQNDEVSTSAKFNFSTSAVTAGGNLTQKRAYTCGCGFTSCGYVYCGIDDTYPTTSVNKYTYSVDTVASLSPNFPVSRYGMDACGNDTIAIINGGYAWSVYYNSVYKLNYSTETFSAGTSMPATGYSNKSGGNLTKAIIERGYTEGTFWNNVYTYVYSTDTVATATTVSTASVAGNACGGNSTKVVFSGGTPGPIATTDEWVISTETKTVGGNLTVAREWHAGCSPESNGMQE